MDLTCLICGQPFQRKPNGPEPSTCRQPACVRTWRLLKQHERYERQERFRPPSPLLVLVEQRLAIEQAKALIRLGRTEEALSVLSGVRRMADLRGEPCTTSGSLCATRPRSSEPAPASSPPTPGPAVTCPTSPQRRSE